ncbi:MAG: GNAT family N-acetyltransferase [Devosia sp.]
MPKYTENLDPTQTDIDNVLAAIVESEEVAGRNAGYQQFSIQLSDDAGNPVTGGLYGYQLFDWLFIQYVGVPQSMQGQGVGRDLLARAEAWSRQRGLAGMWLDTFAFQARPFYEKLGFTVFGEITGHPRGSSRFFLQKRF